MAPVSPFYTGKAVTAEFLNAGQYFGPANPGVSFVAVPTNFWEYPLLKVSSVDTSDFDARYITKNGNVTIAGVKTFNSSPVVPTLAPGDNSSNAASTAFVVSEIALGITSGGFMDLTSAQSVTGLKTFSAIDVPLAPGGNASPVSFLYFNNNCVNVSTTQTIAGSKSFSTSPSVPNPSNPNDAANKGWVESITNTRVDLTTAQTIGGTKTFTDSPVVPAPTNGNHAANKSWVEGITNAINATIATIQGAIAVLQAFQSGMTVGSGTAPYNYNYFILPGGVKFLWSKDADYDGPTVRVVSFPSNAQGFPGFTQPPAVFLTAFGNLNVGTNFFAPSVTDITTTTFQRNSSQNGSATGGGSFYIAIGI